MGLFRKGKPHIIAKFHSADLVICSHSRKRKTLSYRQINMVHFQLYKHTQGMILNDNYKPCVDSGFKTFKNDTNNGRPSEALDPFSFLRFCSPCSSLENFNNIPLQYSQATDEKGLQ